jgi:hypothetical protein
MGSGKKSHQVVGMMSTPKEGSSSCCLSFSCKTERLVPQKTGGVSFSLILVMLNKLDGKETFFKELDTLSQQTKQQESKNSAYYKSGKGSKILGSIDNGCLVGLYVPAQN